MDLIKELQPDALLADLLMHAPALDVCGIPWIRFMSVSPLVFYKKSPPMLSGYSCNSDPQLWRQFRERMSKMMAPLRNKMNEDMRQFNVILNDPDFLANVSDYLNIYMHPEELDYSDMDDPPCRSIRIDSPLRKPASSSTDETLEKILRSPEKKIFFSLGSMGGSLIEVMQRVIDCVSKTDYRSIAALGPMHDKIKLPVDNQEIPKVWGKRFVDQLRIIESADLVITHGGNNSLNEAFHFGKPMIVLPLFADQPSNAQRLEDKGLGIRLEPFKFTEEELLQSIDKLMGDSQLKERLDGISRRIKSSDSIDKAIDAMEFVARTKKSPFDQQQ